VTAPGREPAAEIRHPQAADEPALRELDAATWSPDVTPGPRPAPDRPFFGRPRGPSHADVLVAISGGELAGYIQLGHPTELASNAHVLEITGLAVAPRVRRRGIARALLAGAVREAQTRGVTRLRLRVLSPNGRARALYESAGFVVEGVLSGEFVLGGRNVDDILMAIEVPPAGIEPASRA
jgi:ribosomal protein S18 acetylase RimI-like enzyme